MAFDFRKEREKRLAKVRDRKSGGGSSAPDRPRKEKKKFDSKKIKSRESAEKRVSELAAVAAAAAAKKKTAPSVQVIQAQRTEPIFQNQPEPPELHW